eukprot:snap_masked-scaffold_4-processed-gene-20.22-mRNA-1 protein AED:0.15 eAED:0.15 QI:385/0.66/0.57/1/0.83/0.71/7/0/195
METYALGKVTPLMNQYLQRKLAMQKNRRDERNHMVDRMPNLGYSPGEIVRQPRKIDIVLDYGRNQNSTKELIGFGSWDISTNPAFKALTKASELDSVTNRLLFRKFDLRNLSPELISYLQKHQKLSSLSFQSFSVDFYSVKGDVKIDISLQPTYLYLKKLYFSNGSPSCTSWIKYFAICAPNLSHVTYSLFFKIT